MPQPRVASEIDFIADYLDEQFAALRNAAYGLTDQQARATPCASALSIGGLIKHVLWVIREVDRRNANPSGELDREHFKHHAATFFGSFTLTTEDDFTVLLEVYEQARTSLIADIRQLDPGGSVMVPPEPWHGRHEPVQTTERFHLLHLIEEVARHAGHADLIREEIDGATAMALAFGVEGREGNDFITPWNPPAP